MRRYRITLGFLLLAALAPAEIPRQTLDITRVDVFSLKNWNSTQISVEGLRLGMSLNGAEGILETRGLRLFDMVGRTLCGKTSRFCAVSREAMRDGTLVAVGLKKGQITSLTVGFPEDPATLPQTIADRFRGMTRMFFFHYSDELRLKLLGRPDRIAKSPTSDPIQAQQYSYDRLGLVVYTNRYLRLGMKRSSAPELSSIEFVMPREPAIPQR